MPFLWTATKDGGSKKGATFYVAHESKAILLVVSSRIGWLGLRNELSESGGPSAVTTRKQEKKKKVTSETYDHILWIYTHWFSLWLSLFIPKAVWGILPFSDGSDEQ